MFFKPGDMVPDDGLYEAVHGGHRPAHPITSTRGRRFPACNVCGGEVRFRLLRPVAPLEQDEDFA